MPSHLDAILALEVPVIVRLADRTMPLREVTQLVAGAIIELPKLAEEPLDLLVNNRVIGIGYAVKVGENFGLRVERIGDVTDRIRSLGPEPPPGTSADRAAQPQRAR